MVTMVRNKSGRTRHERRHEAKGNVGWFAVDTEQKSNSVSTLAADQVTSRRTGGDGDGDRNENKRVILAEVKRRRWVSMGIVSIPYHVGVSRGMGTDMGTGCGRDQEQQQPVCCLAVLSRYAVVRSMMADWLPCC